MNRFDTVDDPRRRLLVKALTLGLFSATALPGCKALAWESIFGDVPEPMPEGKSIYRMSGHVTINGFPAAMETIIRPGDTIETGKDSEIVFVVNGQSMILRSETKLTIEAKEEEESLIVTGLRLLTGKLLSVSRETEMTIHTPVATTGIRGTGWYAEADPEKTYFCTCYGQTEIVANNDPDSRETVSSYHHDRPLYILGKAPRGRSIIEAPFVNHTDEELMLIEALVGRTPPFAFEKDDYSGPRMDY